MSTTSPVTSPPDATPSVADVDRVEPTATRLLVRRVAARVTDMVTVLFICLALVIIGLAPLMNHLSDRFDPAPWHRAFAATVLYTLVGTIYEVAFLVARGQTPGKDLMNVRVVDAGIAIPALFILLVISAIANPGVPGLIVIIGVVGTLGAYWVGPWVIDLVYDAPDIGGRTLAMLALSSAIYMGCIATGQAVIALHGHRLVAAGWLAGVLTFVVTAWLSSDLLFRRIEIGLVVSSAVTLLVFSITLRARLAAGVQPTTDSVMEAITEIPLEQ